MFQVTDEPIHPSELMRISNAKKWVNVMSIYSTGTWTTNYYGGYKQKKGILIKQSMGDQDIAKYKAGRKGKPTYNPPCKWQIQQQDTHIISTLLSWRFVNAQVGMFLKS